MPTDYAEKTFVPRDESPLALHRTVIEVAWRVEGLCISGGLGTKFFVLSIHFSQGQSLFVLVFQKA